jgi:hypothetical protein
MGLWGCFMEGGSAALDPEVLEHFFGFCFAMLLDQHSPQRAFPDPFLIVLCHFLQLFFGRTPPFADNVYPFLIDPGRTSSVLWLRTFQTALLVFLTAATGARIIAADSFTHVVSFSAACGCFVSFVLVVFF